MFEFYQYNWIGVIGIWLIFAYPIGLIIIDSPYQAKDDKNGKIIVKRKRPLYVSMIKSILPSFLCYLYFLYLVWVFTGTSYNFLIKFSIGIAPSFFIILWLVIGGVTRKYILKK